MTATPLRRALLCSIAILCATGSANAQMPADRVAIEHALDRLTFGPRPGDIDRVAAIGFHGWLDQQLTPSTIDDPGLAARLPAPMERPASFDSPKEARQWGRRDVQRMAAGKLIRATYSERQLEEVLVDFWFNHFNVFAGKGRTATVMAAYERDAIRPHVLGRFRDLLGATAKSPAMLFYLDNWQSTSPQAPPRGPSQRARGLNENYGRELLELHTLGVDAGYTQADVTAVARAFTGWTINGRTLEFRFAPTLHDTGSKTLLGETIAGGGVREGERVLDLLAAHPATARHIAMRLAQRFVADEPPAPLVDRAAARFRETGGDLRDVMRVIVTSPEFFDAGARKAKVKSPLEFVVSAARAVQADLTEPRPLLRTLQQLGMPLYMCQPPTGYANTADAWVSSGGLVNRMNAALEIARLRPGVDPLVLGSPEFQRR